MQLNNTYCENTCLNVNWEELHHKVHWETYAAFTDVCSKTDGLNSVCLFYREKGDFLGHLEFKEKQELAFQGPR